MKSLIDGVKLPVCFVLLWKWHRSHIYVAPRLTDVAFLSGLCSMPSDKELTNWSDRTALWFLKWDLLMVCEESIPQNIKEGGWRDKSIQQKEHRLAFLMDTSNHRFLNLWINTKVVPSQVAGLRSGSNQKILLDWTGKVPFLLGPGY